MTTSTIELAQHETILDESIDLNDESLLTAKMSPQNTQIEPKVAFELEIENNDNNNIVPPQISV